ncbi:MAG: DUF4258 domain-containing protein [Candidatus Omnitrophica bacterium]|nr:DUF4258 domain-containing protein [Candidatus Omnitrophota bacterium]MCA9440178.1 DUF4258 domain-containing protein [Candidatus Omnitrophota bacterium]MCB9784370.1 DUF4258 domain-containing protein [Candidatus Omnitrophota bacterium]
MKDFDYTNHVLKRCRQRDIDLEQIKETVKSPDIILPGNQENTVRVHRTLSPGKNLQVIYKETSTKYRIISAMWREE